MYTVSRKDISIFSIDALSPSGSTGLSSKAISYLDHHEQRPPRYQNTVDYHAKSPTSNGNRKCMRACSGMNPLPIPHQSSHRNARANPQSFHELRFATFCLCITLENKHLSKRHSNLKISVLPPSLAWTPYRVSTMCDDFWTWDSIFGCCSLAVVRRLYSPSIVRAIHA